MTETILLALIIAKIKGYKLKYILKSWTIYPVLLFELIYILFEIQVFAHNYGVLKYAGIFKKAYLLVFIALIYNYKQYINAIIGSTCIIIGSILNNIAINANGGKMPVFPTLSYITGYLNPEIFNIYKDIHAVGTGSVNYKYLTDIIDIGYSVLSVGDVFIRIFAFIIIYGAVKESNKTSQVFICSI